MNAKRGITQTGIPAIAGTVRERVVIALFALPLAAVCLWAVFMGRTAIRDLDSSSAAMRSFGFAVFRLLCSELFAASAAFLLIAFVWALFQPKWITRLLLTVSRHVWRYVCLLLLSFLVLALAVMINKNLWTSSFAVFMAGMAMNCFAVCYWLIDVQGWRKWCRPFAIYGMNAITVFVLAGVLGRLSAEIKIANAVGGQVPLKTFLYDKLFHPFASPETAPVFGYLASPQNASLMWAVMYVVGLYLVAYLMFRKKWLIKF